MFDKFGEMSSYKEINTLAENLFNEGDIRNLYEMAEENGIPRDIVELYIAGDIPNLCDASEAAIGKIEVESKELELKIIMVDWVEYLKGEVLENDLLANQVRKREKSIKGMIGELLGWSADHQVPIDKEMASKIAEKAGVNANRVTLGIPGMAEAKRIIRDYYMAK